MHIARPLTGSSVSRQNSRDNCYETSGDNRYHWVDSCDTLVALRRQYTRLRRPHNRNKELTRYCASLTQQSRDDSMSEMILTSRMILRDQAHALPNRTNDEVEQSHRLDSRLDDLEIEQGGRFQSNPCAQ